MQYCLICQGVALLSAFCDELRTSQPQHPSGWPLLGSLPCNYRRILTIVVPCALISCSEGSPARRRSRLREKPNKSTATPHLHNALPAYPAPLAVSLITYVSCLSGLVYAVGCWFQAAKAARKEAGTARLTDSTPQRPSKPAGSGKKDKANAAATVASHSNTSTASATQPPSASRSSRPSQVASSLPTSPSVLSPATPPSLAAATAAAAAASSSLPSTSTSLAKRDGQQPSSRSQLQYDNAKKKKKYDKSAVLLRTQVAKAHPLFSHLPQYERETSLSLKVRELSSDIPPAVLRLGLAYSNGDVTGSNARCVAMLSAFLTVIREYEVPANKILRDDLLQRLKPWVRFITDCRPMSASMGNALRTLKLKISKIHPQTPVSEAKAYLLDEIDSYIRERITLAHQVIVAAAVERIADGDVVMTYATSYVIQQVLLTAKQQGKDFSVVLVDSRPKHEGRRLLQALTTAGITCHYCLVSSLSAIIQSVTLVLLSAHSMLSNGALISRCGTALVAMVAHRRCIPVLVCCETYKFVSRVQLDAICSNELADPDELLLAASAARLGGAEGGGGDGLVGGGGVLGGWRDVAGLKLLNLVYDLTPVEFVTMVVTEVGNVPPTSVPVIVREYDKDGDAGDFD